VSALEPVAESPTLARLRARTRLLNSLNQNRRNPVALNHARVQSGMFDSEGDGHPPRDRYMPAHTRCEPVQSPETATADPTTNGSEEAQQTGA
jgi:hypothetical protein